jgi:hypothetical protein
VVSLHLLLNDETRGFLSRACIEAMKPGVILVNTARGALVDEEAMIDALKSGQIRHAGLDVFNIEPLPADHPLTKLPNVTLSAHSAFRTPEASENLMARRGSILDRPTIEAAASFSPRCSSIIAPTRSADRVGDALPGDVGRRAVHRLEHRREIALRIDVADGAMPMVPVQAGPRSERMSPNRFEPTTTSNQSGCSTKFAVRMSMWYLSHFTSG